jgi:hypothetical protein
MTLLISVAEKPQVAELDDARGLEQTERIEVRGEVATAAICVDERPHRYAALRSGDRRHRDDARTREHRHRTCRARAARIRLATVRARIVTVPAVTIPGRLSVRLCGCRLIRERVAPAGIDLARLRLELIVHLVEKTERTA